MAQAWQSPLLASAGQVGPVLRYSLRRLRRGPVFALAVIGTLGLGMGVATAVFSVVEAVVLQPLPYPQSDRLVRLRTAVPGIGAARWGLAKGEYLYLRERNRTFEEIGLYRLWSATAAEAGTACSTAHEVLTAQASAGLAEVLGVQSLAHGRVPQRADEPSEVPEAVWLTHAYWHRCFVGDPAAVGREMKVDGIPVVVAGVLPPSAKLPEEARRNDLRVDVWVPLYLDPAEAAVASHVFRSIGRLRATASQADAEADLAHLTARLPQALPEAYSPEFMEETGFSTEILPLREDVVGNVAGLLWLLLGSCGLVLVVASGNAANLLLARAAGRRPETAMRAALGCSRVRLAIDSCTDSLVLALASGIVGLGIAAGAVQFVNIAPLGIPRLSEVAVDWRVAFFSLLLSIVVGGVLGVLPLVGQSGCTGTVIREGGRGAGISRRQRFVRHTLVVSQAALSVLTLTGALLLFRTVQNLLAIQPGINPRGVLTFRVVLPEAGYESFTRTGSFYRRLSERLQSLPGIDSVGLTSALPFSGFDGCSSVYTDATASTPDGPPPCLPFFLITPGYLETLEVPLRGRGIEWSDLEGRRGIAVASRAAAERLWPDRRAISAEFRGSPDSAPYRIVGIVGDIRGNGLDEPPVEALYLPLLPSTAAELWPPLRDAVVAVRVKRGALLAVVPAIRETIASLDPRVPVANFQPMTGIINGSMARVRFLTFLISSVAVVILLLTSLGIYGLMSYMVARRRGEIGVRLALGCDRRRVRRLVIAESLRLTLLGAVLGLACALAATRILSSYLFGVQAIDPLSFIGAAALLIAAAVSAAWRPAARATRVSPSEILRQH